MQAVRSQAAAAEGEEGHPSWEEEGEEAEVVGAWSRVTDVARLRFGGE